MERYSYQSVLGTGNFSKAWLVRSRLNNRPYVVKEVNVSCMSDREREQAVSEVAILARLRHVNIVRYREALITAGGVLSIVMEFADGGNLAKEIDRVRSSDENFDSLVIMNWFVQLCFALQYIHSEKILHRDLKPSNLFLMPKGILKVGDFGIAKMLHSNLDQASTAIETPYYLSPETCRREPYNQKSDMWAAGCVLYELVMLKRPFQAPDISTLTLRILHGGYAHIPRTYDGVFQEVVGALLSTDPRKRPSAQEVLAFPSMRPSIKSFGEEQSAVVLILSSPTSAPRLRQSTARQNISASSLNTKSSLLKRQCTHERGIGSIGSPCDKKECVMSWNEVPSSVAQKSDSPWVKHRIIPAAETNSRVRTSKMKVCHRHFASEPVHSIPNSTSSTPSITLSRRSTFSSRQHSRSLIGNAAISQDNAQRPKSQGRKILSSRDTSTMTRKGTVSRGVVSTKKRRSCIPTSTTSTSTSLLRTQQDDDVAHLESPKKRRRSLPERVKDSKFLSRLVSIDGRLSRPNKPVFEATQNMSRTVGERLKCQAVTCDSPKALSGGRVSNHLRVRSEPSVKDNQAAAYLTSRAKATREVSTVHQSLSPLERATSVSRKRSNVPITCLFPLAPLMTSKTRSQIKHGTYTLNLPTVVSHDSEASCQRCGCKCNVRSTLHPRSLGSRLEVDLNNYRNQAEQSNSVQPKGLTESCGFSSGTLGGLTNSFAGTISPAIALFSPDAGPTDHSPSTYGKFERGNVIRKPVRHAQRRKVRSKVVREEQKASTHACRFGLEDDEIPSANYGQTGSKSSEINSCDFRILRFSERKKTLSSD